MKVVILAGGFGSRITEESMFKPKPMVDIGDKPLLWHIMKSYSHYGFNEFIICLGYKGNLIKDYFANYFLYTSDVTYDMSTNSIETHKNYAEPWKITMVDTGLHSLTGERIRKIRHYLKEDEDFCLTYGDGLSDINLEKLVNFHKSHDRLSTVSAIQPQGRFGSMHITNNEIESFQEKPPGDNAWVNAGFFVLSPKALDYIPETNVAWEDTPLNKLVQDNQMMAYKHNGFWQNMDTVRDKNLLEEFWNSGNAPWKIWN